MIKKRIVIDNISVEDMFLTEYINDIYPQASFDHIFNAIMRNDIMLNEQCLDDDVFVAIDDVIDIDLHFFQLGVVPVLDITYEDENFLVIEKMPGIASFDEDRSGQANVYDMALEYLVQKGECNVQALIVPYLCYSVSKLSGGIVLIAKNEEAFTFVDMGLKQRQISMQYEALVANKIKKDTSEERHFMNKHFKVVSKPNADYSPIITRYKKIEQIGKFARIEATPVTCRKYQVNAHLAHLGMPVLGDYMFGNTRLNTKYYMDFEAIWLRRLTFRINTNLRFFYLNDVKLEMEKVFYPAFVYKQKNGKR